MLGSISPNPNLTVRHTQTPKGRGVFAQRAYQAGEVVEVSPVMEIEAPWESLPRALQLIVYEWGYLAGDPGTDVRGVALGLGSLFNHADQPSLVYAADIDKQALVFTAVRDIPEHEELTIDYNADIEPGGESRFSIMGIKPIA